MRRPAGPPLSADLTREAVEVARRCDDVDLLGRALLARILVLDVPGGRHDQLAAIDELVPLRDRGLARPARRRIRGDS